MAPNVREKREEVERIKSKIREIGGHEAYQQARYFYSVWVVEYFTYNVVIYQAFYLPNSIEHQSGSFRSLQIIIVGRVPEKFLCLYWK